MWQIIYALSDVCQPPILRLKQRLWGLDDIAALAVRLEDREGKRIRL